MAKFELPELPYEYDALEPYIDEETLHVHHDKHHQAYCDKFNAALESANIDSDDIIEIFSKVSDYPIAVRNQGGGYWNHTFYWESMSGDSEKREAISDELKEAIESKWGSFEKFQEEFSNSAAALFGSGWTWLGVKENGELIIHNTSNQDNTFMDIISEKYTPILVIDVWEHAYYIKYQNKRPEYISQFWNVIDWEKVSKRYEEAK